MIETNGICERDPALILSKTMYYLLPSRNQQRCKMSVKLRLRLKWPREIKFIGLITAPGVPKMVRQCLNRINR